MITARITISLLILFKFVYLHAHTFFWLEAKEDSVHTNTHLHTQTDRQISLGAISHILIVFSWCMKRVLARKRKYHSVENHFVKKLYKNCLNLFWILCKKFFDTNHHGVVNKKHFKISHQYLKNLKSQKLFNYKISI